MTQNHYAFFRKIIKILSVLLAIFLITIIVWFHNTGVFSYIYTLNLENQWNKLEESNKLLSKKTSRMDFEKILYKIPFLVKHKKVTPAQSGWGNDYKMQDGEIMIQYTIASKCDMEVVYDSNNDIVVIFTSYE